MDEPDRGATARESLERLTAALQVAVRALEDMTDSSQEACVALDTIERILSDGREGVPHA
jgi:hypothetical protein